MSEEPTPQEAGLIKEFAIRCAHDDIVSPKELKPNPRNPNRHPPKQLEMFIAILGFQGWRRPITVSKRSGFVTKGHGALEAALAAGCAVVPIDYQDYDNEYEELADLVADNQLQRMSEMDIGKLTELLGELDSGQFNLELTGFDGTKLEKILDGFTAPGADKISKGTPVGDHVEEGAAPSVDGEGAPANSQIRMVQLFLNEETQAEFMRIVEFFQKEIEVDNVTDAVMEVLRSAFAAHTQGSDE